MGSPQLLIPGITCVAGNQRLSQVISNTLTLLDAVNAPAIPVAAGMTAPLLEELLTHRRYMA
ncbi:MAG: nucleoside hydrolase [Caldilineaceae bacterium]